MSARNAGRPAAAALTALLGLAASPTRAQFLGGGLGQDTLGGAAPYGNPIQDSRVYVHGFFSQLEDRFNGNGSYLRWDGQAWAGNDWNKIYFKTEGRYNADNQGRTTDGLHQLLYDRPVSRYFDVQGGVRLDLDNGTTRTWAALGIQGLAIDFWYVSAAVYASDDGHYAFRANAFYDLYLTQRLALQPQLETNWYTKEDRGRGIGAGVSDIDAGLRLRYEFSRKLAPYVGVAYQRFFGGTESLTREQPGGQVNDLRAVVGLYTWF